MPEQKLPLSDEVIHKELDLIQDVIKRMAENSFKVKAWMIGILGGIVAFSSDELFATADESNLIITLAFNAFLLLPIFCFWYLDAFFLKTEKLYREVYKWVVENRKHTDAYLYDLNTFNRATKEGGKEEATIKNLSEDIGSIWNIMNSKTLRPFYIFPLVAVAIIMAANILEYPF